MATGGYGVEWEDGTNNVIMSEYAVTTAPVLSKIDIYNSTTFGGDISLSPHFEYAPPGPLDFMRFRMGFVWQKLPQSLVGSMGPQTHPIKIARNTPNPGNGQGTPYLKETRVPVTGDPFLFKQVEKVTIEPYAVDITAAGNTPELPVISDRDKWLKALDTTVPTMQQPDPGDHGIISTFSRLQETEGDNSTSIYFSDHVFKYDSPLAKKAINDHNYGTIKPLQAEVKSVYNFFVQSYESILTREDTEPSPPESILPSLYSFLSFIENEGPSRGIQRTANTTQVDLASINTIFEKHITLDGLIDETRVDTTVTNQFGQQTITDVTKGQYFDKYAYAFANEAKEILPKWDRENQNIPVSLAKRFKNQIAPASNLELFSTFNDIIYRFPMYCDITFSTDSSNTRVLEALEESKLTTMLIKDFVDTKDQPTLFGQMEKMPFNFLSTAGLPFVPSNDFTTEPFKFHPNKPSEMFASGTLDCWDMIEWASTLSQRAASETLYSNPTQGVFLGKLDEEVMMTGLSQLEQSIMEATRNILILVFNAKFKHVVDTETRTWQEIVGGEWPKESTGTVTDWETHTPKKAYHETLFYKVEKWEARTDGTLMGSEPIQNFYFPNSTQIEEHKFLDTQVKYGKRYVYRIYAFEIVFGTKYTYKEDAVPGDVADLEDPLPGGHNIRENQARFCIESSPSVKLIKVPYYEKQVVMMDDPPVWPDVDVIPYRGVKDKLLFWLKGNVGDYKLNPIIIQPRDQEIINSIRLAQDLNNTELVRFKSDDQAQMFEVFRIEKKPNKYSDFIGAKIAHIDTSINQEHVCRSSTSGEWVDTIKPNQKYYYIFRTIDNHGHTSNPSPVYELEMVHDGYAPFLLRNAYFLEDTTEAPQTPIKNFAKYIHIKPAYSQKLVNKELSGLLDSSGVPNCDQGDCLTQMGTGNWVRLGTSDQTLWDKKIKIRLISKTTGKRIDLNIKFTHEMWETGENNNNNNLC